jgi:enamine deaminase RidA (YjgF/YER057c/UK114 family)
MQERRVVSGSGARAALASQAVVAGGFVYVSGLSGRGDDGKLVGPGLEAQARRALDRLKAVLEAAGSSMAQAVAVNVYLRYASDFPQLNDIYREYFPEAPPTRTTVVADPVEGALVEFSAVAVPVGVAREIMHPAGWIKSPRPYSYIVKAGDLVFLSGLVSRRGTDDQPVPGWVDVQTRTILDNATTLLRTAGLTLANVVASRVYITSESSFEQMNEVYRTYFPTAPPARATAVAGLMSADGLVEITLLASTTPKQVIGPVVTPSLPLSTAIRAGRRVFLSGVLGYTDANMDDLPAQTRETFARIRKTLDLAGLSFSDVVENTVYLPDLYKSDEMDKIYREIFPVDPPARTVVGARLVQRAGLLEVMATAFK